MLLKARALFGALAVATCLLAGQAAAQATNYTFTGGLYTTVSNAAACTVGECTTYTTAQRPTATLTFAAPFAPNLPVADRTAAITAYSFSDGVRTATGPGPNTATYTVRFGTDASGLPTGYQLLLERTPGPPYPINTPSDPNSHFSYFQLASTGSQSIANAVCGGRGSPSGTAVSGPGACNLDGGGAGRSSAVSSQPTVVTSAPVAAVAVVPTLTEWAMILFGLMLAGGTMHYLHRRHTTA